MKRIRQEYLALLYFSGPFLLLGAYVPQPAELWTAILAGGGISMVILFLYGFLLKKLSANLPFRIASGIIAIPLSVFSLGAFSLFIQTCVLRESLPWMFPAVLVAMAIWAAIRGERTIEGFSRLMGPAILLFFAIVIISAVLKIDAQILLPKIPLDKMVFRQWLPPVSALYLLQGFVLLTLLASRKTTEENPSANEKEAKRVNVFRDIAIGMGLSILLTSGSLLASAQALGHIVFETLPFPFYYPPVLARDTEYLERIEILWLAILFFAEFVKQAALFTSIRKIFKPQ